MDHRPLCLSPDIIWLMIIQGVANHINVNAEALRSRFVRHEGKVQISVRRDDFVKGSPENPWAEAIDELTSRVEEHIGSEFDLFQPTFTTTGPVERAAAGVVLLDAMQSYFTYDMDTFCGIPAITLEGTPEDWQAVADRAERFGSLELEWWLEPLRGILQQFVAASQGVVDRQFWQSLYKYQDESGGPTMTGWISALFPYLTDSQTGLAIHQNPYLTLNSQRMENLVDEIDDIDIDDEIDDEIDDLHGDRDGVECLDQEKGVEAPTAEERFNRLTLRRQQGKVPFFEKLTEAPDLDDALDEDVEDDSEYLMGAWLRPIPPGGRDTNQAKEDNREDLESYLIGPRLADIPSGMSKAPFRWDYLDRSFDMEFLGGFVGVAQDPETLTLRPEIGWAVREALAAE